MKKIALSIGLATICLASHAQFTNFVPVVTPSPTNFMVIPGTAFAQLFNMLPAIDPNATNAFQAHEFNIKTSPLWKSYGVTSTTPFLSTSAEYFFTKNLGLGGEAVLLGSGTGSSEVLDSGSLFGTARLPFGNIAFYVMGGAIYDNVLNKFGGEIGGGAEYHYTTQWGIFADVRYVIEGSKSTDRGPMSRIGVSLRF